MMDMSGEKENKMGFAQCSYCNGSGSVMNMTLDTTSATEICPLCNGQGYMFYEDDWNYTVIGNYYALGY